MHRPPTRIDILEKTQFGIPMRALVILGAAALAGGAVFFGLLGAGLILAAMLAVLVGGLGVALAFGQIGGQKPEAWLLNYIDFKLRARHLLKGAQAQPVEPVVAVAAAAEKPEPAPAPESAKIAPPRPAPSFFALSGTAACAATLVGLTLYLATGGAAGLTLMFQVAHGL